jgi:hypothetical protein
MLRFIDLTGSYWNDPECGSPVCAFLCVTSDLFLTAPDGLQVFMYQEEVDEHPQADRMNRLMPTGFLNPPYAKQMPPQDEW